MSPEELFKRLLDEAETALYLHECEWGHCRSVDEMVKAGDLPLIAEARQLVAKLEGGPHEVKGIEVYDPRTTFLRDAIKGSE
jgi:hypothetical protein